MLEFFAAVDPMTLPVWAVLLLSAAMYPLGFMLGAPCSACCDKDKDKCSQPCNKCVHANTRNANGQRCPFNDGTSLQVTVGNRTRTWNRLWGTNDGWYLNCGQGPVVTGGECSWGWGSPFPDPAGIGNPELPNTVPPCGYPGTLNLTPIIHKFSGGGVALGDAFAVASSDECGCISTCGYEIEVRGGLSMEDDYVSFGGSLYGSITECSQTQIELEFTGFVVRESALGCGDEAAAAATVQLGLEWMNSLEISATLTVTPCECEPCCYQYNDESISCEDNVNPDFGCPENVITRQGASKRKGAGLECDNLDCVAGACCDESGNGFFPPNGCVDVISELACEHLSQGVGNYYPGARCIDNPCGVEGACCDGAGNCTQTTQVNCPGTWTEGVECDPNPCPPGGSCCDGAGNCTQTTQANCSGTWTEGGQCDPNPCPPPPTGACCSGEDGCVGVMTEGECSDFYAGTWINGADCESDPCT